MSFIGFTIWFLISAVIVGATLWSTSILFSQKRAWQAFAKKHRMAYDKGRFFSSPSITGHMEGFRVAFFAAERQALDVRQRRMLTAMEITFPGGLVDGGAVGTGEMLPFLNSLAALHPFTPKNGNWDANLHFYVRNDDVVQAWLSDDRLSHIISIVGTKNSDNLMIFDGEQAVIRIETRDPLADPDKMEKAALRIIRHAKALTAPSNSNE